MVPLVTGMPRDGTFPRAHSGQGVMTLALGYELYPAIATQAAHTWYYNHGMETRSPHPQI